MVLVGYWPLNEDSGDTAYDHSGNDNHASVNGATSGAAGILGTACYSFDGNNDLILTDKVSLLESEVSITAWVYVNGKGASSWNRFVSYDSKETSGSGNTGLVWDEDDNRRGFGGKAGWVSGDIPTGRWLFLVSTFDGSQARYYEDSVLLAEGAASLSFSECKLSIGARSDNEADNVDGRIQEVRLYDHALTQAEVQYLYRASQRGSLRTSFRTS